MSNIKNYFLKNLKKSIFFYLFDLIYFIYSNMRKLKNMKIDENLHTDLKKYAKENSLKLNDWVEKIIKKEFEKIKEKNDTK